MRSVFLFVLSVCACLSVLAQAEVGVKAGFTLNNLHTSGAPATTSFSNYNARFSAGVSVEMKASENFYVQPELNYLSLRTKETVGNQEWKYSYITLPVLLKYRFSNSGCNVFAGPQLGFLSSAKSKVNNTDKDIRDLFNNTDVSGVIGVDYKFKNGFFVDVRYQSSFIDLLKQEYVSKLETRTRLFNASVGFILNQRK
jgi:Outer membrane protein beta-barrel domain